MPLQHEKRKVKRDVQVASKEMTFLNSTLQEPDLPGVSIKDSCLKNLHNLIIGAIFQFFYFVKQIKDQIIFPGIADLLIGFKGGVEEAFTNLCPGLSQGTESRNPQFLT